MDKYEKEYRRMRASVKKFHEEQEELKKYYNEIRREELRKQGITMIEPSDQGLTEEEKHKKMLSEIDKPGTMSNGSATLLWIVAMIVSLLFKGGWMLCVLETIIWWKFITR